MLPLETARTRETWKDEVSLKAHMESEHFRRLVPAIEEVATLTLEKFEF